MRHAPLCVSALLLTAATCGSPAPAGLTDREKSAIDSLEHTFTALTMKGDFGGLVAQYYADDAVVLPPNAAAVTGHAAIEAFFRTFPPISNFQLRTEEVVGAGDVAYARGHYAMTMTPSGGTAIADSGKYLEVWRKQKDGSWKVARDMYNSDVPMPVPDTTSGARITVKLPLKMRDLLKKK